MDEMMNRLGYAIRGFSRSPGFTLIAVLTLALGSQAVAAMSFVNDETILTGRGEPMAVEGRWVTGDFGRTRPARPLPRA